MPKRAIQWGIVGVLLFLAVWMWGLLLDKRQVFSVTFFDVGQGDAIFIETEYGHQILIDGGPDGKIVEKLGQILPPGDKTLDLIIVTHQDKDHAGGFIPLLKSYDIDHIVWTGVSKNTEMFETLYAGFKEEGKKGAVFHTAHAGQRISWGGGVNDAIEILHPDNRNQEGEAGDSNDNSIVALLKKGGKGFLFAGDIEKKAEAYLLSQKKNMKADVLKVAHHGSNSSTGTPFIAAVRPEIAVIQVGKQNKYGHPDGKVLESLWRYGINVFRTDERGDIKISITND